MTVNVYCQLGGISTPGRQAPSQAWEMILTRLSKVGGSTLKVGGIVLWAGVLQQKEKSSWARASATLCFLMVDAVWPAASSCSGHHAFPAMMSCNSHGETKISPLSFKLLLLGYFSTVTEKVTHTSRNEFSHSHTINRWLQTQDWYHLTHTLAKNIPCLLSIWLDKDCWIIEEAKQNAGQLSKAIVRMKFRGW